MAGRLHGPGGLGVGMALVLVLAAWSAATCQSAGATSVRRSSAGALGGVNVIGLFSGSMLSVADRQIAAARKLHARVMRAELRWSTLEPLRPGQVDASA